MLATTRLANVTNVSFSWTSPTLRILWTGVADSYRVRYKLVADTVWNRLTGTDDTGIDIPLLTPGYNNIFEIVSIDAAGGETLPVYYGYIIPQGLTPPRNCVLVSESATQADISWVGDNTMPHIIHIKDETGFVDYQRENDAVASTTAKPPNNIVTMTATIVGLNPDLDYKFSISATWLDEIVAGECYLDKSKQCC